MSVSEARIRGLVHQRAAFSECGRRRSRLRNGDCPSCTASPCRSVSSNTGSPVVLVKSASTMVSLSVSSLDVAAAARPRRRRGCAAAADCRAAASGTPSPRGRHARLAIALQPLQGRRESRRRAGSEASRSFSRHLPTMRSSSGGTSGFSCPADTGVRFRMPSKISPELCSAKGHRAGRHLVQHHAEREQVGAGIESCARTCSGDMYAIVPTALPGLVSRASAVTVGRGLVAAAGTVNLGQPEIENLRVAAAGDEQIRRLDVAVDDPGGVRGVERVGDLDRQRQQRDRCRARAPPMRCFSVIPSRNSMTRKARPPCSPMS